MRVRPPRRRPFTPKSLISALRQLIFLALLAAAGVVIVSTGTAAAGTTTSQPASRPVLVIAHRGASAEAPEHTGPAYDRAVWAGADVLECDLQLTADEQLVCLHDPNVDRTTGGAATGPVSSFTLAEVREMDFGSWFGPEFTGARIVTLEEQITCYRSFDPTLQFYIETKVQPDQGDRMEVALVELLERLDVVPEFPGPVRSSPVIIQSFSLDSLATIRRLAPELPTAYLFGVATPEVEAGQFPDVDVLAPNANVLAARPDLIESAHEQGLEVHTYTVDDPAQMQALIDAGVDGFFTNDPTTGRAVVDQAARGSGRAPLDVTDTTTATSPIESCPEGMGIGLTAAPAEIAPPLDDGTTPDDDGDASDTGKLWPVGVGVAVLVVIGIFVLVRRRNAGT